MGERLNTVPRAWDSVGQSIKLHSGAALQGSKQLPGGRTHARLAHRRRECARGLCGGCGRRRRRAGLPVATRTDGRLTSARRADADLIEVAKARPGELTYAASPPGTAQHLAWERFKRATGTDLVYVSYRGTGALMPDLLGGRLNAAIDNVAVMTQYIKGGQLIGLAVTSPHRSPGLPEMPTLVESGLPGFQAIGWFRVFAPARTPQPIVRTPASQNAAVM